MFTQLQAQNFKSWQDTGLIKIAPLTGFFGTNSSGKTAILQLLLMLKQTVESTNRKQVLFLGDEKSYVNLGTYKDIVYNHQTELPINLCLNWTLEESPVVFFIDSIKPNQLFFPKSLAFETSVCLQNHKLAVQEFSYGLIHNNKTYKIGMQYQENEDYQLLNEGYSLPSPVKGLEFFPSPIKTYGFPPEVYNAYPTAIFLPGFVFALEKQLQNIYYLGPLREYPKRNYSWNETEPQGVGKRGEDAIPALLASRLVNSDTLVEQKVAYWLKELNLIDSFDLVETSPQTYQFSVKKTSNSPDALITDVGFGVSQILPILVLCYYVPERSTIILEQPEIHLHPFVQAGLADVFIDVIKTRNIQIILESHSEHLLRRLQRRIAEEKQGFSNQDATLYFCQTNSAGTSQLIPLELDAFGNINNWPDGFFGDEMGELFAMTEAAIQRQLAGEQ